MIIDFQYPSLEVLVNEDVEAEDLEAVALAFVPPSIELNLLLDQREWLHGQDAFLASFRDLLK